MKHTKKRVYQLTSAHPLDDERILHRMAWTLARADYESVVVGFGTGAGTYAGIKIVSLGEKGRHRGIMNRFRRSFQILKFLMPRKAVAVQFHDPDLLMIVPILRVLGFRVIYDVHDDYEAAAKDRVGADGTLGNFIPKLWWIFEKNITRLCDGVVVADRYLARKFSFKKPVTLGNFPRLDFTRPANTVGEKTFNIIYVGGVSRDRGVDKVLDALDFLPMDNIRFHVIGGCQDSLLLTRLRGNKRVIYYGRITWVNLHRYYERAHMGVALYQPLQCFLYCPGENVVKLLEYMASGIPVLCSNFSGLKVFVENVGCGLTVPPDNPRAIADKIRFLYENPEIRIKLGQNGRRAFDREYHWEKHEEKLVGLYEEILA